MRILQRREAFTMVEVAVAVVIVGIVSVVVVTNLLGRRSRAELDATTRQVVTMLREAQNRSANQEEGTVWGVHFENSTDPPPFFALFKTSYSQANIIDRKTLPSRLHFPSSTIPFGGTTDITFAQITGLPSTSTSINLNLTVPGGSSAPESITRESSGLIFFDDFNRTNL